MNYKTAIIPIVSVLALAWGTFSGHPLSQNLIQEVEEIGGVIVGAGVSIWGIYKNHKGVK